MALQYVLDRVTPLRLEAVLREALVGVLSSVSAPPEPGPDQEACIETLVSRSCLAHTRTVSQQYCTGAAHIHSVAGPRHSSGGTSPHALLVPPSDAHSHAPARPAAALSARASARYARSSSAPSRSGVRRRSCWPRGRTISGRWRWRSTLTSGGRRRWLPAVRRAPVSEAPRRHLGCLSAVGRRAPRHFLDNT